MSLNVLSIGDCLELTQSMITQNEIMSGKSYMITGKIEINTHVTLPPHVTLIFAGGMIIGSGTLTGNYTRLEASITQIFGADITVDGIWEMDRAYPQWFGARNNIQDNEITTVKDRLNVAAAIETEAERDTAIQAIIDDIKTNGIDSSDAINKAMKLKHAGEVFIPKGHYLITETLHVPYGIVLYGELADYKRNYNLQGNQLADGDYPLGEDTIPSVISKPYKLGTIIRPLNTKLPLSVDSLGTPMTSFTENFTIMINVQKQITIANNGIIDVGYPWKHQYPYSLTTIQNILFSNHWTKTPSIRGIYSSGGMNIENISWIGFVQAVVSNKKLYCDGKNIINCAFNSPTFIHGVYDEDDNLISKIDQKEYYTWDLSGLGDKLFFHRNHTPISGNAGALKLSNTMGAEISNNIINDNILIRYSKGVSFFSNHCENGAQVEVSRSQVDFSNNYFHKGEKPTFLFHDKESNRFHNTMISTITLCNNSVIFMDNETENDPLPVSQTSPFDIQTDGLVSLSIQNTYRYQHPRYSAGNIYTFGLAILKEIWTIVDENTVEFSTAPFTEFNGLSYLLSNNCLIKPKFYLAPNHLVKNTQALQISAQSNSRDKWLIDSGQYAYQVQTIWDKTRLIGTEVEILYKDSETGTIQFECNENSQSVLFPIKVIPSVYNGNQAIVRLTRSRINNFKVVEVPVCGATYLYDNGISIAGFKWEEQYPISLSVNTNISSVHFVGDNVICTGTSCPLYGTWAVGDIVYNTGTTSTNAMWIYTTNGWQAR